MTTLALLLALAAGKTDLRFTVTLGPGLAEKPLTGRMLVVLGPASDEAPYRRITQTGMKASPVLGADADGLTAGKSVTLDEKSLIFPLRSLAELPPGEYRVQAVLDWSPDIRLPGAPGNLLSKATLVRLDPAKGGAVKLELTEAIPEPTHRDMDQVRWVKLKSAALSKFFGRAIYLRAGVALPEGFSKEGEKYPLRVHIGGFGTRYTQAVALAPTGAKAPKFVHLHLDGAGPLGDPYQVDSANHGPFGEAVTRELIPHVEKAYHCIGQPWARVLDGASTGGWVSLALQVFYPDFFNGAWSHCPDPVDFRDYELIDLYRDDNAYVNSFGFERPSSRTLKGDVQTTVRHEMQLERVLGRGGRWELSGRDWAAWNATFGPRGKDGLPVPVWEGESGKINRTVAIQWRKYDLRHHLESNWKDLAPKLQGKIHIWVGTADEYFLNNAVERLDELFKRAVPPARARVTYGPGKGHSWRGLTDEKMLQEMAAAVEAGRRRRSGG